MKPVVIDNFLSPRYFSRIKEVIESSSFNWHYESNITSLDQLNTSLYSYGFNYSPINKFNTDNSEIFQILNGFYCQLLDVAKCSRIYRSRIDMVTYCPEKFQHQIHVDEYFPHIASIFYITDSDAETIIFDQQCFDREQYLNSINFNQLKILDQINPKENRLLFFDGTYLHTGHSPSKYRNRIIINTDLVE